MLYDYSSADATSSGECSNEDCPDAIVSSNPLSGAQVNFPLYVTLTSDVEGAKIRSTIDGTFPDTLSQTYYGPILIASAGVIVRAIAHSENCAQGSEPVMTTAFQNAAFAFVFSYACDTPDHAGQFNDFTSNGISDHHWVVQFDLPGATIIKRLEIYQLDLLGEWTTGQVWSTDSPINPPELGDPFEVFPLLLFIAAAQQHAAYQSSLGSFGAGSHTWDLYGDIMVPAAGLFKLKLILDDDTEFSQIISATCTSTPPLCPPPAVPTVVGKCDGAVDVTITGTVGRDFVIYGKSDTCSGVAWDEVGNGTFDVSPKTVEIAGLLPGCLYQFYVSVDEAGCGFRDSTPSAGVLTRPEPSVGISTNKTIVDPSESFTISWTSNNIGGAVCGGCLDGQVSINQSMGCKAGNAAGSQAQSQAVCGIYTYQITGCNTCGTAVASVQVEVRCPAECSGPQPFRVSLPDPGGFCCDNEGPPCGLGLFSSSLVWDGQMYPPGESLCGYSSPSSSTAEKYLGGCVRPLSTIFEGYVIYAFAGFRTGSEFHSGPHFDLRITARRGDFSVAEVWIGIKLFGNNVIGTYTQVGGCAVGPSTLVLEEVLP